MLAKRHMLAVLTSTVFHGHNYSVPPIPTPSFYYSFALEFCSKDEDKRRE